MSRTIESARQVAVPTPEGETPRVLMISGMNVSEDHVDPERPLPDFMALRTALRPDVLDVRAVADTSHPLVGALVRRGRLDWAVAVTALIRRRSYDVIMATGEDVGLRLALLATALRIRLPLAVICHNITAKRWAIYLGALGSRSRVACFQCQSRSQARILTQRYGIPEDRIQLLYWHVDDSYFLPLERPVRPRQVCSAGMASRDYATLVAAVAPLDVDLKIAADSPWFRQRLNIRQDLVGRRTEVRSYGTYAALRELYAESPLVVVPLLDVAHSAGHSVILEAMAMGKPVIVTQTGQPDDFVIDGWNGYRVRPGDVGQLRALITELLDDPTRAAVMGANGRHLVEERFRLGHFVDRMRWARDHVLATSRARA
jgi:glycosyltransferase involved in cell wall biosynthesis